MNTPSAHASILPPAGACDPGWAELLPHRRHLVHYASRRLPDPALAEDLVHDVFETVVTGRAAYGGRAALRTWLVGILKHKIIDMLRRQPAVAAPSASSAAPDDDDPLASLECPGPGPEDLADQRQQLQLALARIQALPEHLREVLELRALHDLDSADACRQLRITPANLFVRMHRARRMLAA